MQIPMIGMTIIFPNITAIVLLLDSIWLLSQLDCIVLDRFTPRIIIFSGTAACPTEYIPSKNHSRGALLSLLTMSTKTPLNFGIDVTMIPHREAITGGWNDTEITLESFVPMDDM